MATMEGLRIMAMKARAAKRSCMGIDAHFRVGLCVHSRLQDQNACGGRNLLLHGGGVWLANPVRAYPPLV